MKNTVPFVVLAALLLGAPALWAAQPQAVLNSLKGKVEVRAPGTKTWVPATEGQVLSPAATLSTGFDSSVVVVIDKTTIQVKPLTRMTIDKLVEDSGTVKTSTFLRVGSVSASVKSAEGVKQDFKVQSPYSTASVRGTEFSYDGQRLRVREGLVAFIMGRPIRDTQSGEGSAEGQEEDFVGAPDVAANENEATAVPAGQEIFLVVDYTGGGAGSVSGSMDRDNLEQSSSIPGGSTGAQPRTPTKGSVSLSIQFAP